MEIKNWRDLKIGQHVQLNCGCAGFVKAVYPEGPDPGSIGFVLSYTKGRCAGSRSSRWGFRNSYSDGLGPYNNFFNYGMPDDYYPIIETSPPTWWPKFEDGPSRKLQELKRAHRKKQIEEAEKRAAEQKSLKI